MVNLIIDDKSISAKEGSTILETAFENGIEIPHLCYHKALPISANCRMCLVETNKSAKLVPSCFEKVSEGLVVNTKSYRVKENQKAILEFILLNHPIDCPICDKAGECELQELYYKYSLQPSRLSIPKHHKIKLKKFSDLVTYDAERCILCTRCVRFFENYEKKPQLVVINRGENCEISTFLGKFLSSPYSMNIVDICPCGALTSTDFRFKCRVWFLQRKKGVCVHCSRGCSIYIDSYKNKIQRIVARENQSVNKFWLCDEGRLSFHEYEKKRVLEYVIKENGWKRIVDEDEALYRTIQSLNNIFEKQGKQSVYIVASSYLTNEDAFFLARFNKEFLNSSEIVIDGKKKEKWDEFLIKEDKNPNRNGLNLVFSATGLKAISVDELFHRIEKNRVGGIIVVGYENQEIEKILPLREKIKFFCVLSSNENNITEIADILIPSPSPYEKEGTFINYDFILQRFEKGIRPPLNTKLEWIFLRKIANSLKIQFKEKNLMEIFKSMSEKIKELKGMDFLDVPFSGVKLQ